MIVHKLLLEKRIGGPNPISWETHPAWIKYIEYATSDLDFDIDGDLKARYNARYKFESPDGKQDIHSHTYMYFETAEEMMIFLLEWS
jgi:hypothetical protein